MAGDDPVAVSLRGRALLRDPWLNKGTAFTASERQAFDLEGLLPHAVETLELQVDRVRLEYETKTTDLGRHIFLRQLADASRVLFYRFLVDNLEELLPIVYTPTVGQACRQYSRIYRRPHGLFVSYPDLGRLDAQLANAALDDVRVVVATDGERILGLGDQGAGGMGIPIGKLALYTACGGIHPATTLPVLLDAGTNNPDLLADPMYLGWRHERIDGADYDRFVGAFVAALGRRWPRALLQWEDFARHHAQALLDRYRSRICSFNDDIQGTAAVILATVLAGARHTGTALADQRVVIAGAGSAGVGAATMLAHAITAVAPERVTRGRGRPAVFLVDRWGLVHDGAGEIRPEVAALAPAAASVAGWSSQGPGGPVSLLDTVAHARPTVLIGLSGQGGLFSEEVVRAMARQVDRPVILPLSNPTDRAEAHPDDVARWTGGRALVATGSPFPGVAQANNVYVFPGLGLGAVASEASAVTDGMIRVAALAVAAASPPHALLPPLGSIRAVSRRVALAVARAAVVEGVARERDDEELAARVDALVWEPRYPHLVPAGAGEPDS